MLASTSESRSINISSMNESGAVVLASHGSYAERHINISFDLLDAEDSVAEAQDTVSSAEIDLFTAYNNYCWAVERGILN